MPEMIDHLFNRNALTAKLSLRAVLVLAIGFLAPSLPAKNVPETPAAASASRKVVRISTEREGDKTHFYVTNEELCEATLTFEMDLVNLKAEHPFPYTGSFPGGQRTLAFTLSPVVPGKDWKFSYTNYFKLGSHTACHDDHTVYELPYQPGKKYKVTQSANGSFSHHGSNRYAVDWKMPVGTPVCAARGGLVVKLKKDSTKGGPDISYDKFNNYVLIRHDDGTLGHYCHLSRNSITVNAGERVQAGQVIARSGNTGFSSGPHLHFAVFVTKSGKVRESVPLKFRTAAEPAVDLMVGRSYQAAPVQTAAVEERTAGS